MKVEKKTKKQKKTRILLYSWLPTGAYCKYLAILKKNSKSGKIGPFFHEK